VKLAEALILRSDLLKKLQSLKDRIQRFAVVQEGDKPHEDPKEILKQANGAAEELRDLVVKIETANHTGKVADGRTIARALADRDLLINQHALVAAAIEGTKAQPDRYGVKEIKWVATISVKDYQKRLDDYAKAIREVNVLIQEANWKYEIQ
jgi:hypothetical protein